MVLRARHGPALLVGSILALLLVCFGARPARAWVDVHVEGDDVRLSVDRSGRARVEHRITLKISGGPLRSLDVRGVDRDAVPEPEGYVVPLREANQNSLASAVPVSFEVVPPGNKPEADGAPPVTSLRIRFQNNRGLGRGVYVLLVRYGTDLSDRITVDGAMSRIAWRGPVWDDGLDAARVTFELPAAPNEPRAEDTAPPDGASLAGRPLVLSTVRRGPSKDTIELLRPYVPKGEVATWSIHADLRAWKATSPENARPTEAPPIARGALPAPAHRAVAFVIAAAVFLLYSLLVAWKSIEVARDARARLAVARPLLPIPTALRAVLAGLALVAGLALEFIAERATLGALVLVLSIALAAHRAPRWQRAARLRGKGRWLPMSEAEALRDPPREPGGLLDASTRPGKVILILALGALAAGVYAVNEISPYRANIMAFDAVVILAIFCTGRRAELPPRPSAPARFLRDVARRVRRALPREEPRIVGKIRIPDGQPDADELRLALAPRHTQSGFISIEVGVVYAQGAGGSLGLPEVLLRVTAGSRCEEAIAKLARHGRSMRGRKPNERVIAFCPLLPTARMTAGLAVRLLQAGGDGALITSRPIPHTNVRGQAAAGTPVARPALIV